MAAVPRVIVLALLVPFGGLVSQESGAIDPAVAAVVSGGSWTSSSSSGQYRVVVRTGGFEHVGSQLAVDWIRDPRSEGDTVLVAAHAVVTEITEGIYSLDVPHLDCRSEKCQVAVTGVNTRDGSHHRWVLRLGPPGQYQVESVAK